MGVFPDFRHLGFGLAIAVLLSLAGCATVMSEGNTTGFSADAQGYAAESMEKGLSPFRDVLRGAAVSIRTDEVAGAAAQRPLIDFARSSIMEMISAEGGVYVGEHGGQVRIEIRAVQAGLNVTERNFAVPAGQNLRIPLLYSEGFTGSATIIVLARDGDGNIIRRESGAAGNGGTDYYLFRFIGPIRY